MNRATALRSIFTAVALLSLGGMAHAAPIVFEHRENVNIMNSWQNVVTAGNEVLFPAPQNRTNLRSNQLENFWDGGTNPPGGTDYAAGTNYIKTDFGESRNIKTVRIVQFGGSEMTTGTVETSNDGINWASNTYATALNGSQRTMTLDNAVDARYMKVVATGINYGNGTNRWVVTKFRVFGDVGTLTDNSASVDAVSSTGLDADNSLATPGVTLTRNSAATVNEVGTEADYVNDALDPAARELLFGIGTGEGFTLQFDRVLRLNRLGMHLFGSQEVDTNADFLVETWNGSSWVTVLNQTNPLSPYLQYYALTPSYSDQLRVTFTTTATNLAVEDVQAFGEVPEPAAVSLLGLAAVFMGGRGKRRMRGV